MQKEITFDKLVRWVGTFILIAAVFYLVNYLSGVLLPFFIAWLFAYLLYPVVKFIENKAKVRFRPLSILITLTLVLIVVGLIIYLIIPPMIEQFQKLYVILNQWVHTSTHSNNITEWVSTWIVDHQKQIELFFTSPDFTNALKAAAPKLFNFVGQTASIVISIIASLITLLYMFFILLDYEYLSDNWIRIFPKKQRPFWRELMDDVARELNNYIRGQGMVALCMGIMFCIGFSIMDFPMAIGLGILIGILDLVPYLHTFAIIPTAFLAMLKAANTGQNFWMIFGLAIGLFIVVQIISDMIVTPKIMGKVMRLNPAILLLSLSVWGSILGFIGLIIALPLTTLIMAYWKRYVTREDAQLGEKIVEAKAETTPNAPHETKA
jgi:predicted PurR-regulated permease PerM